MSTSYRVRGQSELTLVEYQQDMCQAAGRGHPSVGVDENQGRRRHLRGSEVLAYRTAAPQGYV